MTLKGIRFSPRLDTRTGKRKNTVHVLCTGDSDCGVLSGNLLDSRPAQSQMDRCQSHSKLERQPKLAVWDWTGARMVTPITRLALLRRIYKDREGGNKSNGITNSSAATEKNILITSK